MAAALLLLRLAAPRAAPPPPRMALDAGGAAISVRQHDVWAGGVPLLASVRWEVFPRQRWALVGPNGAGKTTLLHQIAAAGAAGAVRVDPALRVGMLEQSAVSGSTRSLRGEAMSRMESFQRAKAALEAAEAACTSGSEAELRRLDEALAAFEEAGGYAVEARVSRVLRGLGFEEEEFDRPCSSFSGGWQMRIGLARLLLSEPDLLLLDEPTNHLDAAARRWLAEYVSEYSGTVLVVSHDKAFIRVACDSIAAVEGGRLETYVSTPYDKYELVRDERRRAAIAVVEKQKVEYQRLQEVVNKWENVDRSKAAGARAALAKLLPEMQAAEAAVVAKRRPPRLKLAAPPPCGILPLALRGASLAHAQGVTTVVHHVDFEVRRGQRIVLRGPNGAGKSTILKALAGSLPLVEGARHVDDRLELGVFAQDLAQELPHDRPALEYVASTVREIDPLVDDEKCRTIMGALGLVGEKALRRIESLSGGEKARVALATFCLTPCNVLLFDEPTNHLDVDSIAALLEALEEYDGAVVVVSHDRPFCEALHCTHVAYVADGRCVVEERELRASDFSEADRGVRNAEVASQEEAEAAEVDAAEAKAQREEERRQQKLRSSAPKKVAKLEALIAEAEAQIAQLDEEMLKAGSDLGILTDLTAQRDSLQGKVDAHYKEWEALEALMAELA